MQARQGRELRRLVEHRVAGEQRRNEDVAADEVGVVPGRDVGDDAERRRGRCARACRRRRRTPSPARACSRRRSRKKSMRAEQAVQLVARLRDAACRPRASGSRASVSISAATAARKRCTIASAALGERHVAAHAGCAARAAAYFAATVAGVVGGAARRRRAVGRIGDFSVHRHPRPSVGSVR